MGVWVLDHPGNHGPHIADMVMHLGALIITFESLPVGPEINEEDGRLDFGIMLLGNNGLLGGVHAADRRAIGPAVGGIPRPDALYPGDFLRLGAIGGALDMSVGGPGCR